MPSENKTRPTESKIRQIDIAKIANVSPPTVSKVLKGEYDYNISVATRKRILDVCKKLEYDVAKRIAVKNVFLGLYETDYITQSYFSTLFSVLNNALSKFNIDTQVKSTDPKYREEKNNQYILSNALYQNGVGIIIADQLISDSEIAKLTNTDIPIVLFDRQFNHPQIINIIIDNEYAISQITEHLINAGHKNIGIMISSKTWDSHRRMLAGYASALIKNSITFKESNVFEVGMAHLAIEEDNIKDYQKYLKELDREILSHKPFPTAIITAQDSMAITLIDAAKEKKIKLPGDLVVTGYENTVASRISTPPFITTKIPFKKIEKCFAEVFSKLLLQKKFKRRVFTITPDIIYR